MSRNTLKAMGRLLSTWDVLDQTPKDILVSYRHSHSSLKYAFKPGLWVLFFCLKWEERLENQKEEISLTRLRFQGKLAPAGLDLLLTVNSGSSCQGWTGSEISAPTSVTGTFRSETLSCCTLQLEIKVMWDPGSQPIPQIQTSACVRWTG